MLEAFQSLSLPRPQPTSHSQLRLWKWTMVPPYHHVSLLINLNMTTNQISIQVYPMNLLRWHRLGLKSILTHKKHDIEPRSALDQYSGQSDEPRVASSRPKKHMQIESNTKCGPDFCLHLQRRISPLHPDTGLQSPLGLIPINLNTIQTHLIIGK